MSNSTLILVIILVAISGIGAISFEYPQAFPLLSDCDASYPDICIPPYPPDLNCRDISEKNFAVTSLDPHGFDRDKDGKGCES